MDKNARTYFAGVEGTEIGLPFRCKFAIYGLLRKSRTGRLSAMCLSTYEVSIFLKKAFLSRPYLMVIHWPFPLALMEASYIASQSGPGK